MVDDLQNLRLINVIHRLGFFIVVHKNQFFLLDIQQVPSGNCADIFSSLIHHRECPVTVFCHHLFHFVREIVTAEGDQVIFLHKIFYGNTLINQSGHRKGIIGCGDDYALPLRCQTLNSLRHLCAQTDNQTAGVVLDGTELILRPVGQNHHVIRLNITLHHIRMGGTYQHLSLDKISVFISHQYLSVQRIRDTAVLGSGL